VGKKELFQGMNQWIFESQGQQHNQPQSINSHGAVLQKSG